MRTRRNLPGLLVDFPTVVNNLFNDDLFNPHTTASAVRKPAVNIVEDQDSYGLAFMVPGFEKNDFKIKIENNTLTVAAEHTSTEETSQKHYPIRNLPYRLLNAFLIYQKMKLTKRRSAPIMKMAF